MLRCKFKLISAFILLTLLVVGCVSVNYIGKPFDPTNSIDVYFAKEEIEKEYIVLGHAISTGTWGASNEKIKNKLVEEAKSRGADAILITGIGKIEDDAGLVTTDQNQINAVFLTYK